MRTHLHGRRAEKRDQRKAKATEMGWVGALEENDPDDGKQVEDQEQQDGNVANRRHAAPKTLQYHLRQATERRGMGR